MSIRTKLKRNRRSKQSPTRKRAVANLVTVKNSRSHRKQGYRGPKISRVRVRMLRDDLDRARLIIADTFSDYWLTPEGEIRETLEKTQRTIGRAVDTLSKAA